MVEVLVLMVMVAAYTTITMLLGAYIVWRRYESAVENVDKRLTQNAYRLYKRTNEMTQNIKDKGGDFNTMSQEFLSLLEYYARETLETTQDVLAELRL